MYMYANNDRTISSYFRLHIEKNKALSENNKNKIKKMNFVPAKTGVFGAFILLVSIRKGS